MTWAGRERRFSSDDINAMKIPGGKGAERLRLAGLYVRVSATTGQESPLDAEQAEPRATATGTVPRLVEVRASGRREDRPGLEKMLTGAADRQVTVARVRHEDRPLLEDFIPLVTTFAGHRYGMRSAAARKRLLTEYDHRPHGAGQ